MKFLLIPENNSLSHIAKALAVREGLQQRGHEVHLAVSAKSADFLDRLQVPYCLLPGIQEQNGEGFPAVAWFRQDDKIREVIEQERRLLETLRPDRVLGIFRFTLKAAARLAGIPYDSLICSCLLPGLCDAYGYAKGEPGEKHQAELMSGFFRFAGARLSRVMAGFGLPGVTDAREMLVGEQTFLWDFPEFLPHDELPPGCVHVGPIAWNDWPRLASDCREVVPYQDRPLALLSFGTCVGDRTVAEFIVQVLGEMGFHVLLAAGGQQGLSASREPWFEHRGFAPLHQLWNLASLLVSHGGQMTVFEALAHEVPVAVMPFQPEQAHNGVCLEALGCGRRLTAGQPFLGNSSIYQQALLEAGKERLRGIFSELISLQTARSVARVGQQIRTLGGVAEMVPRLESAG